jgi:hypothetical protein
MQNSTTLGAAVQTYLTHDPRRINPFNHPGHTFQPSDDPEADQLYLAGVKAGTIARFYVTASESIKPGHLQATIYDRHNGNIVICLEPRKNSGFVTKFGAHEARMFPLLELIQQISDEQGVEINLDEDHAKTHSAKGAGMVAILRDMLAQNQGNLVDAQLFAEGVALAQSQQSPVKLWHDEQRRGYFSISNPNVALAGA